jgi:hypothetical protein
MHLKVTSFFVLGRFRVCSIEDFFCYLFCKPVPEALLVPHWVNSVFVKFAFLIQMVNESADLSVTGRQSDNSLTGIGLSPDQAHLVARLVSSRLQHHIVVVLPDRQDRTCNAGSNISGLRPGRLGTPCRQDDKVCLVCSSCSSRRPKRWSIRSTKGCKENATRLHNSLLWVSGSAGALYPNC